MKNNTTNDLCENNRTSCPWKSKVFIENNYIMHNGWWPAAENLLAGHSAILIVYELYRKKVSHNTPRTRFLNQKIEQNIFYVRGHARGRFLCSPMMRAPSVVS